MRKLEQLISELENNISDHELTVPHISTGSVGWHIEHSLLVLNTVIGALAKSDPSNYKRRFDIRRTTVMLVGKIPRGKIRAPKAVQPTTAFNKHSLQQHVYRTRESLKTVEQLSAGHYFTHPFLGDFKLRPALKFITIHTNHHYNIIQDIVRHKRETKTVSTSGKST